MAYMTHTREKEHKMEGKNPIKQLLEDASIEKEKRDEQNRRIQEMMDNSFVVTNQVQRLKRVRSKELYQTVLAMWSRMKPLDFSLHGNNTSERRERLVSGALSNILKRGGYDAALRGKDGVFQKILTYGDAFLHFGANPDKADDLAPLTFTVVPNSNVYVDPYALAIRGASHGRNATKLAIVYQYPEEKAYQLYPELKGQDVGGAVVDYKDQTTGESDEQQADQDQRKEIEVCYFYDISGETPCYKVVAGKAHVEIETKEGSEYPYIHKKKPYIPVCQFVGLYGAEGFYNQGYGSMFYDVFEEMERLFNMNLLHLEDGIAPITMLQIMKGKTSKVMATYRQALKLREKGLRPIMPIEFEATNPNASQMQPQTLVTQNMASLYQMVDDMLNRMLRRAGVNLDGIQRGEDVTATQIMAEEESSNAVIKQIMENNGTETQFLLEVTLDLMGKMISKTNKTPVNYSTTINMKELGLEGMVVEYGMIAEEILANEYWIKPNLRTGSIPSGSMQRVQMQQALQVTDPSSPYYSIIYEKYLESLDQDIEGMKATNQEGQQPQLQQAQRGGQTPQVGSAVPSQTERATINPRIKQQQPII